MRRARLAERGQSARGKSLWKVPPEPVLRKSLLQTEIALEKAHSTKLQTEIALEKALLKKVPPGA